MMRDVREMLARALAVVRRGRLDREFDEEFSTHVAMLTERHERRGLSRHEARRQAILQMGGPNATKALHRESRGLPRLERTLEAVQGIGKDLRHAARSLARARTFALVCIVSLGVGMGAFVGLVTFFRALTAPARGIETDGLVELLVTPHGPLQARTGVAALETWSYPDALALSTADPGLVITAWAAGFSNVGPEQQDDTAPPRVMTYFVSPNYFDTFGVVLARGQGFDPVADDQPGAAPRVVVSHAFWRNRLASDPDSVGKTLLLDGVPHEIVGLAPEEFRGHFNALDDEAPSSMLFLPLARHPRLRADAGVRFDRALDWVHVHGRLAPGMDLARANAVVSATMAGLAKEFPVTNAFKGASVEPYFAHGAAARSQIERVFSLMLALAGMVLLIVCVNLSGMMLVRGATRERELSIREAVGASRRRLVQYLFFEAVWLALIGGGLSVLVLFGVPAAIARWLGQTVPPEMDLDATAVAICSGLCLVVSLVLGLLPALRLSRPNLLPALKDDAGGGGWRVGRLHRATAAGQVAIAVPFLVVSGVMLDRVRTADFGFDADTVVAARVDPAAGNGPGRSTVSLPSLRATLAGADGVASVTMADGMPIDFNERDMRVAPSDGTDFVGTHVTRVADGYLETLGVRLLRGRSITAADRDAAARVAVLSESLAARLSPDREIIGQVLTMFSRDDAREEAFTVIGVSADFATAQLTTARPQMLVPLSTMPTTPVYLIARGAAADESRLTAAFEGVRREFDLEFLPSPFGVFHGIVPGRELVEKSLNDLVYESLAVAVAGSLVLILASLGVLGVIAFMVATRTREIAVRMALGATRSRVVGLMLLDVIALVTPGVVVGLLLGAILIRAFTSVLGTPLTVGPTPLGAVEPLIYVVAAAMAVVAALLAGLPAAHRAASVQPMVAMRSE